MYIKWYVYCINASPDGDTAYRYIYTYICILRLNTHKFVYLGPNRANGTLFLVLGCKENERWTWKLSNPTGRATWKLWKNLLESSSILVGKSPCWWTFLCNHDPIFGRIWWFCNRQRNTHVFFGILTWSWVIQNSWKARTWPPFFTKELATSTRDSVGFSRLIRPWVWDWLAVFCLGEGNWNPLNLPGEEGLQTFLKACLERSHFLQFCLSPKFGYGVFQTVRWNIW